MSLEFHKFQHIENGCHLKFHFIRFLSILILLVFSLVVGVVVIVIIIQELMQYWDMEMTMLLERAYSRAHLLEHYPI